MNNANSDRQYSQAVEHLNTLIYELGKGKSSAE